MNRPKPKLGSVQNSHFKNRPNAIKAAKLTTAASVFIAQF